MLNDLLKETAESGEWKNIERDGVEVKSVQDNTQGLPDHFTNDEQGLLP